MNFTHLHLHTQYSLLDGAILIPELIEYLKKYEMKACAITDHGWMAGVIDFYKNCKANNIKPLIGVEAYITEDEDGKENKDKVRDNGHLVLIAKNNQGYRDLLRLCSEAALNNFYYKPRISKRKLTQLSGNVVVTTACLGGVLADKLEWKEDEYGRATECFDPNGTAVANEVDFYLDTFGQDFYLEIQEWDSGDGYQQQYNRYLLDNFRARSIPFVIAADAHYLRSEDYELHKLLMALQMKMTVAQYEDKPEMQYGPYFYVKTPEEMMEAAKKWNCEEAFHNTNQIADQCDVSIELGSYQLPRFKIEEAEDYREFLKWKECAKHKQLEK